MNTKFICFIAASFLMCKQNEDQQAHKKSSNSTRKVEKEKSIHSDFSGKWVYVHNNERNDYSLDLLAKNTGLIGSHCFIGMSGNRIDCPDGNEKTIKGIIKPDGSFEGKFTSEYVVGTYNLKMKVISDTLYWDSEVPTSKVFYKKSLKFVKNKE